MRSFISASAQYNQRRPFSRGISLAAGILTVLAACSEEVTQPAVMTEATDVAVAIDSINPPASEAGETLQVRVVGAGFKNGAVATVERAGSPAASVVAEETSFMDQRELRVTVNVGATAVPALYDVVVSNPDGTRAIAGGIFAVEDATPIVVSGAEPSEAGQGETRTVRIFGSGFREGDRAAWERDGETHDNVAVEQTEFISSGELVVTLNVQAEATIDRYDVSVNRPRKKGIGTEAFVVLPGRGSELQARLSFTYDGYRSDSFDLDDLFGLDPATMNPGSWGMTYFGYESGVQVLSASHLRHDGLVDELVCLVPGIRVREPGTRPLECWLYPQVNWETGEDADPELYTSWIEANPMRPGDGSGTVTFTSVTAERLAGTFSIIMHVEGWEPYLESPSITISDGEFDLPIVSSYWSD